MAGAGADQPGGNRKVHVFIVATSVAYIKQQTLELTVEGLLFDVCIFIVLSKLIDCLSDFNCDITGVLWEANPQNGIIAQ